MEEEEEEGRGSEQEARRREGWTWQVLTQEEEEEAVQTVCAFVSERERDSDSKLDGPQVISRKPVTTTDDDWQPVNRRRRVPTADFLVQADDFKCPSVQTCGCVCARATQRHRVHFLQVSTPSWFQANNQIGQIYLCQLQRKAAANEFRTTYEHTHACTLRVIILN